MQGVLFDLLMAVMNSPAVWAAVAGTPERGMRWRDAVTERIRTVNGYLPYETLIAEAAVGLRLGRRAAAELCSRWPEMEPWPDVKAVATLNARYAFVTNCSSALATLAAERSGLEPVFVLSAEEAGRYKPAPAIYQLACRRLGTAPAETLFVAGAPYDAEGARRAGLRAVLVSRRADQAPPRGIARVTSLHEIVDVRAGQW